jgi:hypothetical protein
LIGFWQNVSDGDDNVMIMMMVIMMMTLMLMLMMMMMMMTMMVPMLIMHSTKSKRMAARGIELAD